MDGGRDEITNTRQMSKPIREFETFEKFDVTSTCTNVEEKKRKAKGERERRNMWTRVEAWERRRKKKRKRNCIPPKNFNYFNPVRPFVDVADVVVVLF